MCESSLLRFIKVQLSAALLEIQMTVRADNKQHILYHLGIYQVDTHEIAMFSAWAPNTTLLFYFGIRKTDKKLISIVNQIQSSMKKT